MGQPQSCDPRSTFIVTRPVKVGSCHHFRIAQNPALAKERSGLFGPWLLGGDLCHPVGVYLFRAGADYAGETNQGTWGGSWGAHRTSGSGDRLQPHEQSIDQSIVPNCGHRGLCELP